MAGARAPAVDSPTLEGEDVAIAAGQAVVHALNPPGVAMTARAKAFVPVATTPHNGPTGPVPVTTRGAGTVVAIADGPMVVVMRAVVMRAVAMRVTGPIVVALKRVVALVGISHVQGVIDPDLRAPERVRPMSAGVLLTTVDPRVPVRPRSGHRKRRLLHPRRTI